MALLPPRAAGWVPQAAWGAQRAACCWGSDKPTVVPSTPGPCPGGAGRRDCEGTAGTGHLPSPPRRAAPQIEACWLFHAGIGCMTRADGSILRATLGTLHPCPEHAPACPGSMADVQPAPSAAEPAQAVRGISPTRSTSTRRRAHMPLIIGVAGGTASGALRRALGRRSPPSLPRPSPHGASFVHPLPVAAWGSSRQGLGWAPPPHGGARHTPPQAGTGTPPSFPDTTPEGRARRRRLFWVQARPRCAARSSSACTTPAWPSSTRTASTNP